MAQCPLCKKEKRGYENFKAVGSHEVGNNVVELKCDYCLATFKAAPTDYKETSLPLPILTKTESVVIPKKEEKKSKGWPTRF